MRHRTYFSSERHDFDRVDLVVVHKRRVYGLDGSRAYHHEYLKQVAGKYSLGTNKCNQIYDVVRVVS